jgi:hypothetical protein
MEYLKPIRPIPFNSKRGAYGGRGKTRFRVGRGFIPGISFVAVEAFRGEALSR